jgi:predicted dehydrogenase
LRGGSSLGGGFRWLIYGEKGEIGVTGFFLLTHINLPVPWKVRVSDDSGAVVSEEEVKEDVEGQPAVSRLWDAFLKGDRGGWPDFEHAMEIHEIIEAVRRSHKEGISVDL